jgi:hypothetical protein
LAPAFRWALGRLEVWLLGRWGPASHAARRCKRKEPVASAAPTPNPNRSSAPAQTLQLGLHAHLAGICILGTGDGEPPSQSLSGGSRMRIQTSHLMHHPLAGWPPKVAPSNAPTTSSHALRLSTRAVVGAERRPAISTVQNPPPGLSSAQRAPLIRVSCCAARAPLTGSERRSRPAPAPAAPPTTASPLHHSLLLCDLLQAHPHDARGHRHRRTLHPAPPR